MRSGAPTGVFRIKLARDECSSLSSIAYGCPAVVCFKTSNRELGHCQLNFKLGWSFKSSVLIENTE